MNSPASRNPSGNDTVSGLLKLAFDKMMQGVDVMLPAEVLAYDAASNRAQVKHLIKMVTTDNTEIARGQIASVPVAQFGAGGWVMRFPVSTGDRGWIKACDRDISLFLSSYRDTPPNTSRTHSFSDGLFIPDTMLNGFTIGGSDANNAVIQNKSGSVRISLGDTKITIAATDIEIDGNLSVTGTFHNNGTNVGSDHKHSGVQPGAGNTGNPI